VGNAKVAVGDISVGVGAGETVGVGEVQAVASRKVSAAKWLPLAGEKPDLEIIKRDLETFSLLRARVEGKCPDVVRGVNG
jgi:hypothetical protein